MAGELNGDAPLGAIDRLRYLAVNLGRNLSGACPDLAVRRWRPPAEALSPDGFGTASPGRALTEAFIRLQLPKLMPPREIDVLDIGCGSGRTCSLLAQSGYRGRYTGVDQDDRFDAARWAAHGFEMRFTQGDIHTVPIDGPFDLIISISVLEHVADDIRLIPRLDSLLSPDGVQLHVVPAPAGLFVYLWHGYRQYSARALAERFGTESTTAYALGGGASFALHLVLITLPEILVRTGVRQRWPRAYGRLLALCLKLDRWIPMLPSLYAVYRHGPRAGSG